MKKIYVNGGCVSYDFLKYAQKKEIQYEKHYAFRVPFSSINNAGVQLDKVIEEQELLKINDEDNLRNFINYFSADPFKIDKLIQSDIVVFDLYKELYDSFECEKEFYIIGPEVNDYNIKLKDKINKIHERKKINNFIKFFEKFMKYTTMKEIYFINFRNVISRNLDEKIYNIDILTERNYQLEIMSRSISDCYAEKIKIIKTNLTEEDLDFEHEWGASPIHFKKESWQKILDDNHIDL
jgi:hypothetical protein